MLGISTADGSELCPSWENALHHRELFPLLENTLWQRLAPATIQKPSQLASTGDNTGRPFIFIWPQDYLGPWPLSLCAQSVFFPSFLTGISPGSTPQRTFYTQLSNSKSVFRESSSRQGQLEDTTVLWTLTFLIFILCIGIMSCDTKRSLQVTVMRRQGQRGVIHPSQMVRNI